MFFSFPEDARWNAEQQAVEFGVEIGEYRGVVWVPRRVFQRLVPERPTPECCVEAYYLQRTRFESIAERKLRQRQLTKDGNVEISGRDLREAAGGRPRRQPGERLKSTHCGHSGPGTKSRHLQCANFRRSLIETNVASDLELQRSEPRSVFCGTPCRAKLDL